MMMGSPEIPKKIRECLENAPLYGLHIQAITDATGYCRTTVHAELKVMLALHEVNMRKIGVAEVFTLNSPLEKEAAVSK